MRQIRLSMRAAQVSALFCFGFAVVAAGCGGGGTATAVVPGSVASSGPVTSGTPNPSSTCAAATGGVAYIPDGTGQSGPGSLTIVPIENTGGTAATCQQTKLTTPLSIGDVAISAQGIGLALTSYGLSTTAYGIGGLAAGQSPFVSGNPTIVGAQTNTVGATSLAVVANGTAGFAVGPDPSPTTAGFLGIDDLLGFTSVNATPAPTASPGPSATPTPYVTPTSATVTPAPYANSVPYIQIGATAPAQSTVLDPSGTIRGSVALGPDASTILVRGTDLITFQLQTTLGGYIFGYPASSFTTSITSLGNGSTTGENPNLGFASGSGLGKGTYGHGLIAFLPANSTAALIGETSNNPAAVTVVDGLPNAISASASLTMPAPVTSVAVAANGNVGAVGTTSGIYTIANISNGNPTMVSNPSANESPSFTGASGSTSLGAVISVGITPDSHYIAVLTKDGSVNGATDSLLVIPVDSSGNMTAPAEVINKLPPSTGDYLVVR